MIEKLYNKIDKFCNETDWSKYPTYEHALEEFIKEIVVEETKELKEENAELKKKCYKKAVKDYCELEKENAELRKVAEFQQSSNMNTHFENKKLKEGLAVGSTWNKHLNSQNKALEEERDRYRNMTFDQREQLTTAKEIISEYINILKGDTKNWKKTQEKAEQFLKSSEVESDKDDD